VRAFVAPTNHALQRFNQVPLQASQVLTNLQEFGGCTPEVLKDQQVGDSAFLFFRGVDCNCCVALVLVDA
jgi:hypothetical protein